MCSSFAFAFRFLFRNLLYGVLLLFQLGQCEEVGDRARHAQEQQRAAYERVAGEHRQCGRVEKATAQLQGGEHADEGQVPAGPGEQQR